MKRTIAAVILTLPFAVSAFAIKPSAAETFRQERREIRREGTARRAEIRRQEARRLAEIRREQARRRAETRYEQGRRVWVNGRWEYRR